MRNPIKGFWTGRW